MTPSVALCISNLNEGLRLEQTLATAVAADPPPNEVVVVDDGSLDDPHARLSTFIARSEFRFKFIRNDRRTGSGPAKELATTTSTADLVVVSDSHMRFPMEWVAKVIRAHQHYPNSILCPISRGFEANSPFVGRGTLLKLDEHGFWSPNGNGVVSPPEGRYPAIVCPYGGCYIIPRHVLEAIGGYSLGLKFFGQEEEYLAIRACLRGFDVRLIDDLEVQHQYQRKIDRRSTGDSGVHHIECHINRMLMAQVLFEDDVFEKHYKHRIESRLSPEQLSGIREHLPEVVVKEIRGFVQGTRVRTDEALATILGVKHPEP